MGGWRDKEVDGKKTKKNRQILGDVREEDNKSVKEKKKRTMSQKDGFD